MKYFEGEWDETGVSYSINLSFSLTKNYKFAGF
jgi:hypothetical protein